MIQVNSDNKTVVLKDIQIDSPDLHRSLRDINPEKRDNFIENCVAVGYQVLRRSHAVHEVDWIKSQLGELSFKFTADVQNKIALAAAEIQKHQATLTSQINNTFDLNSKSSQVSLFQKALENCFKKFESTIDPNDGDGPLGQLKTEFLESLQELKTEIKTTLSASDATAEAQKKMPSKGVNFEEEILATLSLMAAPRNDSVELVGSTPGKASCKKGDLVYTDSVSKFKIVIEAKDYTTKLSPAKIRAGIEEAMQNREADFGIFVVKNRDCLPEAYGAFHMSDRFLICSIEFLEVAIKFGCIQLQSLWVSQHKETVDLGRVQKSIEAAKREAMELDALLDSCGSAQKAITKVSDRIDRLKGILMGHLIFAEEALKQSDPHKGMIQIQTPTGVSA